MTQRVGNIDVCVGKLDSLQSPQCPHGPTVLFERYTSEGVDQFYGCSSSRDRKQCSFYQRYKDKVSKDVLAARLLMNKKMQPKYSHGEFQRRLKPFLTIDDDERALCSVCGIFLLKEEEKKHEAHGLKRGFSDEEMKYPTKVLHSLKINKTNAQFFFSDRCAKFLLNTFQKLGYKKIVCIGAPRLHEMIVADDSVDMSSLLLDIDHRFGQFFGHDTYTRYNLFNNHFFAGDKATLAFRQFMLEDTGPVAIVTDPPFGGLVTLIAHTVKKMMSLWQETNSRDDAQVPVYWMFPYFMEKRVVDALPDFTMLDYKVEYDNHKSFHNGSDGDKGGKGGKKIAETARGSPVRIFTNVKAKLIPLPSKAGYRYCKKCVRFVSVKNKHCNICKCCPTKDGATYRHCDKCKKCVKPSTKHCETCALCLLPKHECGKIKPAGCHICGDMTHKRRDCPKLAEKTALSKTKQTAATGEGSDSGKKNLKRKQTNGKKTKGGSQTGQSKDKQPKPKRAKLST